MVGDPLEKVALDAVDWNLSKGRVVWLYGIMAWEYEIVVWVRIWNRVWNYVVWEYGHEFVNLSVAHTSGDAVTSRRGRKATLKITHRFHFSSSLKRMSVISSFVPAQSSGHTHLVTVKGAPEVLKHMVKPQSHFNSNSNSR